MTSWKQRDPEAYNAWYQKARLRQIELVSVRNKANPRQYLWRTARRRAKDKGIEFTITVDDIYIPKYCPILGFELEVHVTDSGHRPADYSASLDRIDNNKGYIPGNVRVISWRANRLKVDADFWELKAVLDDLAQIQNIWDQEH